MNKTDTLTGPDALLVGALTAARMIGMSLRSWRRLQAAGAIPRFVRIGRRTLWRVADLRAWVAGGCPADGLQGGNA